MPVIVLFDGIKMETYFDDHVPPHIHAKYADFEVVVTIRNAEVMAGYMPGKQLKRIQNYVTDNQQNLLARWEQYQN